MGYGWCPFGISKLAFHCSDSDAQVEPEASSERGGFPHMDLHTGVG